MSDSASTAAPGGPPSNGESQASNSLLVPILCLAPLFFALSGTLLFKLVGRVLGWSLRKKTEGRRSQLLAVMTEQDKKAREMGAANASPQLVFDVGEKLKDTLERQKDWGGIVGFFHPFWYVLVEMLAVTCRLM